MTIQKKMSFIRKPDIIQEFLHLFRKLLAHRKPIFLIGLGQLVLDLDPLGIKFEILNQNARNRRYRFQVLGSYVAKIWIDTGQLTLEPCDILGCSGCYRRPE